MFRCIAFISSLLFCTLSFSQVITFDNPSFEDTPRHSREPRLWTNCGFPSESPPDTQPDFTFQVRKGAYEGNTYLGLVTRDNDTWESVGSSLSEPLQQGSCYSFQIALAKSLSYYSISKATRQPANYMESTRLRIWGGNSMCDREELLAESSLVMHSDWRMYLFVLQPLEDNYSHLIFEVFYPRGILFPTNGNLLLDAASAIVPMNDCDSSADDILMNLFVEKRPPFQLSLPRDEPYLLQRQDMLKAYVSEMLGTIQFHPKDGELLDRQFYLGGEKDIHHGSPQLYALQLLMIQMPEYRWELVVAENDDVLRELKTTELEFALAPEFELAFSISGSDTTAIKSENWFAKPENAGLFLRRLKID